MLLLQLLLSLSLSLSLLSLLLLLLFYYHYYYYSFFYSYSYYYYLNSCTTHCLEGQTPSSLGRYSGRVLKPTRYQISRSELTRFQPIAAPTSVFPSINIMGHAHEIKACSLRKLLNNSVLLYSFHT